MFRSLLSVGGFTLLSRVTGFVRDIIMASVMGSGPLSDAFLIAFRLPNHFRTIFAEGAYNAGFVPLYTSLRAGGGEAARSFARNMLGWQIAIQLILLAIAFAVMPWIVTFLAPGIAERPEQLALAVELTRITFAYLFCVAIVTHIGGVLNAEGKFWAAAAAPVLLNIAMAVALSVAFLFPSAAHAAAWGVFAGGFAEVTLLAIAARSGGFPVMPVLPKLTVDVRQFFVRFGPATLGAAGVQLALFVDTILASYLGTGAYTSLYYADRVNQLPMGVIAIALSTVLLPEISRSIASGDEAKASRSFSRATEMGLLLTLPCTAAFFVIPDAIMQGLFARGAFNATAAAAAASVLLAYAAGLPAFVVFRTVTPLFHARGDTTTPVVATGIAIAGNLALKFVLIAGLSFGVEGLALGTALGTWINMLCLAGVAWSRGFLKLDARLTTGTLRMLAAATYAGAVAWLAAPPLHEAMAGMTFLRAELYLLALAVLGFASYVVALLGLGWRR
ncbi:MAG: murein biosynthesis integral membrane protein MurJ [Alphaproteobacteria bacterium]|nr:murein biosynthesis integral membrane protein MurJ [Alphaproteobacteria bacterium]